MPNADSGNTWTYAGIAAMSAWGGVVSYVQRLRRAGGLHAFAFAELIGECLISGFAGFCVGWFGLGAHLPVHIVLGCAGVGAHMGTRALFKLERVALRMVGAEDGNSPPEKP